MTRLRMGDFFAAYWPAPLTPTMLWDGTPSSDGGWVITSNLTTPKGGGVGDIWIDNSYVDFSDPAILAKFVNADGSWISPGYYGEIPTGHSPLTWLTVQPGNPPDDILHGYGQNGDQSSWALLKTGDDPTTGIPYPVEMVFDDCIVPQPLQPVMMLL